MEISRLDHLVLTVKNIEKTAAFCENVMGMQREAFGNGRLALKFGSHKINLHAHPSFLEPRADVPEPGSADLCFVVEQPLEAVIAHLEACGVEIVDGPRPTQGARGTMRSVYIRDPDRNLIELSNYVG